MAPVEREVVLVVASMREPRPSGEIEAEAGRRGIRPAATRLRLAERGFLVRTVG
jgi:hypothetical protein